MCVTERVGQTPGVQSLTLSLLQGSADDGPASAWERELERRTEKGRASGVWGGEAQTEEKSEMERSPFPRAGHLSPGSAVAPSRGS